MANIDSATPTESEPEQTAEEKAEDERRRADRAGKRAQRQRNKELREKKRADDKERKFWEHENWKWAKWERDLLELAEKKKQFKEYWDRRKKDDKDCWRDKDFANAVDKMSRAGYKGKHGNFDVPDDDKVDMWGMYMQATVGDVNIMKPGPDKVDDRKQWDAWNTRKGLTKEEAQNAFISRANRLITLYGWNPPPGWS